ncbi:hypothetical protein DFH27DRAFT_617098 [Peziza echinospora]|nr:hypothetical protein DFH27DRAFT_617098 [Peziza echinospora]
MPHSWESTKCGPKAVLKCHDDTITLSNHLIHHNAPAPAPTPTITVEWHGQTWLKIDFANFFWRNIDEVLAGGPRPDGALLAVEVGRFLDMRAGAAGAHHVEGMIRATNTEAARSSPCLSTCPSQYRKRQTLPPRCREARSGTGRHSRGRLWAVAGRLRGNGRPGGLGMPTSAGRGRRPTPGQRSAGGLPSTANGYSGSVLCKAERQQREHGDAALSRKSSANTRTRPESSRRDTRAGSGRRTGMMRVGGGNQQPRDAVRLNHHSGKT